MSRKLYIYIYILNDTNYIMLTPKIVMKIYINICYIIKSIIVIRKLLLFITIFV